MLARVFLRYWVECLDGVRKRRQLETELRRLLEIEALNDQCKRVWALWAQSTMEACASAALSAMLRSAVFRAVDTSYGYHNEPAVGEDLPADAYLIVKVPHDADNAEKARKAIGDSLPVRCSVVTQLS